MSDRPAKEPKRPIGPVRRLFQSVQGLCTAPEKWAIRRGSRRHRHLPLPDFLGIGAQKAGSSWLWENLRCHPELYLPDQKELHFFDRRYHRTVGFYASKFREAGNRLKGEITPAYSSLPPDRIRFIGDLMPNARILFLMRDPVERAWSHALMHLLDKVQVRRYEEVDPREFYAHFQSEDSRGKGDYLRILEHWESVFPARQIFIGFFEDIQSRPCELFREVLAHLGVSTDINPADYPFHRVVNAGRGTPMPREFREFLTELYAPELARLRERFGERVAHWGQPVRA
jgi:hypothetical protein